MPDECVVMGKRSSGARRGSCGDRSSAQRVVRRGIVAEAMRIDRLDHRAISADVSAMSGDLGR